MGILFALQAFDAHGKESKLAPGVYNLVRDFNTLMVIYCHFCTDHRNDLGKSLLFNWNTRK